MAQGAVFNLAGKVLELLSPLIREEIKLACCLKADLVNLKSTVSIIKDVLLDAEKQAHHRAVVKGWLEKLKDVLHDADDVLDDVATEALQRNVMAGNKMTKEVILSLPLPAKVVVLAAFGCEVPIISRQQHICSFLISGDQIQSHKND